MGLTSQRSIDDLAIALRQVPFLRQLQESNLHELAAAGETIVISDSRPIFREGDVADRLFLILGGQVRIYRRDKDNETALATLLPGNAFGEIALLDGGPRSASAATVGSAELFTLDRDAFFRLLATSPEMLAHIFSDLTTKVRENTERYFREEMAARSLQAEMERQRHQSLAQLVAGVAHEINTPLGIVNTAASFLRTGLASEAVARASQDDDVRVALEDVNDAADLIQRNVARAFHLIQTFKNLSVSQIVDHLETFDLTDLIVDIVDLFRVSARQANLTIEIHDEIPTGSKAWLGYRGYLTQVVTNLLTNVQRYAYPEPAGGKIDIVLRAELDRQVPRFNVAVRDYGRGIEREGLSRVFEPFYTTGRGKGGTGLGMSIVRNLVTGPLQGSIAIESTLGRGTMVTISFPRLLAEGDTT